MLDTVRAVTCASWADHQRNKGDLRGALKKYENALEMAQCDGGARPSSFNRKLQERLHKRINGCKAEPSQVSWPLGRHASHASGDAYGPVDAILDAYQDVAPASPVSLMMGLHGASGSTASLPVYSARDLDGTASTSRAGSHRQVSIIGPSRPNHDHGAALSPSTPGLSVQSTAMSETDPKTPFFFRSNLRLDDSADASVLGPQEFLVAYSPNSSPRTRVAVCTLPPGHDVLPPLAWRPPRPNSPQLPMAPRTPDVERFEAPIPAHWPTRNMGVPRSPSPQEGLWMRAGAQQPQSRSVLMEPRRSISQTSAWSLSTESAESASSESVSSVDEAPVVQRATAEQLRMAPVMHVRLSTFLQTAPER